MPCPKGHTNNPNGRPRSPEIQILRDALVRDREIHGTHLIEFAIEKSRTDTPLLAAILKKILPDKIETDITGDMIISIVNYFDKEENEKSPENPPAVENNPDSPNVSNENNVP